MKPEVMAEMLEQPIIAVISTLRKNGRPYQVPIWFLWRDGVIWTVGTYSRVWCKHMFADPRVSLCIETSGPPARFISVDCTAEPIEPKDHDIWPIARELAQKYVGSRPGATQDDVERFIANMRTEPRLLFRLTPEFWRAIDLTVYRGKRADREHQAKVLAGELPRGGEA